MAEYNSTSNHAEQVASGDIVPAYGAAKLDPKDPHDAALVEAGTFVEDDGQAADPDAPLAGEALKARAQELDIQGRSEMSADELRAAIAAVQPDEGDE